ncbi:MAG: hypothetical protein U0694_12955 [Anaerolineae bacterium]
MNVHVSWDDAEQTIIRYDFDGNWTWDEFHAAAHEAYAMTRSVEHRVHTISYFRPGAMIPPDALVQFRLAMSNAPANRGVTVIVGGSRFTRTLVEVFSKINRTLGERLKLAHSLEEARQIISELQ